MPQNCQFYGENHGRLLEFGVDFLLGKAIHLPRTISILGGCILISHTLYSSTYPCIYLYIYIRKYVGYYIILFISPFVYLLLLFPKVIGHFWNLRPGSQLLRPFSLQKRIQFSRDPQVLTNSTCFWVCENISIYFHLVQRIGFNIFNIFNIGGLEHGFYDFPIILGISWSQLTHIFQRGRSTTIQRRSAIEPEEITISSSQLQLAMQAAGLWRPTFQRLDMLIRWGSALRWVKHPWVSYLIIYLINMYVYIYITI